VGPGAHGRIGGGAGRLALSAERDPAQWAAQVERDGHGLASREPLTRLEQAEEMLLMGLRLAEGLSLARLASRTGHRPSPEVLRLLRRDGLISRDVPDAVIRATPQGRLVLNSIIEAIAASLTPTDRIAA